MRKKQLRISFPFVKAICVHCKTSRCTHKKLKSYSCPVVIWYFVLFVDQLDFVTVNTIGRNILMCMHILQSPVLPIYKKLLDQSRYVLETLMASELPSKKDTAI